MSFEILSFKASLLVSSSSHARACDFVLPLLAYEGANFYAMNLPLITSVGPSNLSTGLSKVLPSKKWLYNNGQIDYRWAVQPEVTVGCATLVYLR